MDWERFLGGNFAITEPRLVGVWAEVETVASRRNVRTSALNENS
jgi:hypothetical protein